MQVGDLVKVAVKGLRTPIDSLGVITRVQEGEDVGGAIVQYWVRTTGSCEEYWFRHAWLEVISASR